MNDATTTAWLDAVHWDEHGLLPVVAQDSGSGRVLTLAWMNREALALTVAEGRAVYWSRSRGKLWRKGEESGHVQRVQALFLDCDGDALLLQVHQEQGIACHTGRASCFHMRLDDGVWRAAEPVLKDPAAMYGGKK